MMMIIKAREIAKAVVALVTPIIAAFVSDSLLELSTKSTGIVTAIGTAIMVWLVPNKSTTSAPPEV